jgi:hypothetical protein
MLESPSSRVLNALREWLHGPTRVPNDKSKLAERDVQHQGRLGRY